MRLTKDSTAVLRRYLNGILTVLFVGFAAVAQAQSLPAQFSVTGVAADDVLVIRSEPSADSPAIGELLPYAINVEVMDLARDGSWGMVWSGESVGWVAMRYMERQEVLAATVPRPLYCYGTEPFWHIGLDPRGQGYELMGEARRDLTLISESIAQNGYLVTLQDEAAQPWTLIVERRSCSDGMSDRLFGFSVMLFSHGADGAYVHTGCCTLDGS